ncbi:MAG: hypothetical protein ACXWCY_32740 [Burkholderiales bacterium]
MHLWVKGVGVVSLLVSTGAGLAAAPPDAQRSFKAEVLFRLTHPCPTTGETRGECRGYVIDRIIPVVCGGAEEPGNMQWQTIAQAREKDRWERIGCRRGRKLVIPGPPSFAEAYPLQEPPTPTEVAPLPVQ